MKNTRAILVDDEQDALDVLQTLINFSNHPIEIVAKCKSLKESVAKIKELQPDVVFMDIQMPEYAGYEIIKFFDEINFEIVFVTAFDQYAVKAFDVSAIDYLVKPVNRDRLDKTLSRIVKTVATKNSYLAYQNLTDSLESRTIENIVIPEIDGNRILKLADIICIQGYGSYSIVYLTNDEKVTISKNLKYFQNLLSESDNFFRSQKSWIINLSHVLRYNANQGNIFLTDNNVAKLSPKTLSAFESNL